MPSEFITGSFFVFVTLDYSIGHNNAHDDAI